MKTSPGLGYTETARRAGEPSGDRRRAKGGHDLKHIDVDPEGDEHEAECGALEDQATPDVGLRFRAGEMVDDRGVETLANGLGQESGE